ncbi:MAG: 3-oxoacyl-ACP reductase FabG [Gammaproteobacteria bacterium]|nr:3-oxoacyl-ACP reductase FabG [Gammaproteobacteria bacterium]NIR85711.1 3-oxoacyl-ACP reductase FabG [Gammaproteobacteria bacterium]NIR90244.1 3-oxoacyl-ACP reductase FabG [Gammaproteobacteria bacterium]NIU06845.1 3-oxoacyl-ACP reductase FabG [Gammaproteobacteria bacterium]NIV53778.1 3-oxoacyl-ACP reductase FabG [Gammaproteobacteria bacterium]
MTLEGRTAVVSGASRGIGEAIALELGRQGARVIGTATTEAGAETITRYLRENGCAGRGAVLDVADRGSIQSFYAVLEESKELPTILVNNAGITRDNLFLRMKEEEWDAVIETDLSSLYRVSKPCIRHMMKERWGRIINIASVVGCTGNPGQTNYAAAKAGTVGFTRALARELGSRGITVNAVAPGFIDTDMTRALPDAQRDALMSQIPLNRFGNRREVGAAVAFLASSAAAYITGETLHVNGGMYMG